MINRQYDKLYVGLITGTLVPLITFGILYIVFEELSRNGIVSDEGFSTGFRLRTISLVSIAANVILVRYYQNRYAYQAVRGVIFPTFILVMVWIIYYSNILLG